MNPTQAFVKEPMNDEKKLDAAIDKAFDKLSTMPKEEFMKLIYPPRVWAYEKELEQSYARFSIGRNLESFQDQQVEYLSLEEHEAILSEERARLALAISTLETAQTYLVTGPYWDYEGLVEQTLRKLKSPGERDQPTEDKSGESL